MLSKRKVAIATACATLVAAAPATAATTWTPVPSGTTQDITAIEYRSETQAWFATGEGQIFSTDGAGAFQLRATVPGAAFTDVEFSPDGSTGLATSASGQLRRSIDGGLTWNAIVLLPVKRSCLPGADNTAVTRLEAAIWADATTAYVVGGRPAPSRSCCAPRTRG